ncbi:MAG: serine kinase [Nostoc sp. TH1S01]|nr:serine kinase [Nostoc sp. TH1S01]
MFIYFAYNLCIHSQLPLPELNVGNEQLDNQILIPDVTIYIKKLTDSDFGLVDGGNCFLGSSSIDGIDVGKFFVHNGSQIIIEPVPEAEEGLIRSMILGSAIPVLLRQRGLLVLHASCVNINGAAVAFLGNSGWGKSTLASAFHQQGYGLLTDDVLAIQVEGDHPITFPSYPQVRLLPDSASSLGYEFDNLSLVHSACAKRNNVLSEGFSQLPLPIKQIYALENVAAAENAIQILSVQEIMVELLRHSRATTLLTTPEFVKAHFQQSTSLIKSVPIRRLKRKRSLAALSEIVQLVEADIAANSTEELDDSYSLAGV